jgi:PAS domain S-box-containing protein
MSRTDKEELKKIIGDSEKMYRLIVGNSLDYIWILNKDEKHVYISPSIEQLRGITPEEGFNEKLEDSMTVESYKKFKESMFQREKLEKQGIKNHISRLELQYIQKNGSLIWVESISQPIYSKKNNLIGILGITRNIEKRKKTELALKRSEEKYRELIENSLQGLYIIKDNKIHFCNQKFANIFGYNTTEEVIGIDIMTLVSKNSTEVVREKVRLRIEGKEKIAHYNFKAIKKSGEIIEVETLSSQIFLDGEVAIQGTLRDVTKQQSDEELLRKLSQAVKQSPTSIMITSLTGNIEYVNPQFIELTGYSFDEVKGKNASILKSNHTSQITYKNLWQTITSGNEWNGELLNKNKNGELYWESTKIAPIKNNKGLITHFVGIKEDITEQKRIQEELIIAKEKAIEADKLKTSFLANMSHEIRTPMNAIMGFSSLLSDSSLTNDEKNEFIQLINSNSSNLLNLIDDIIDIAKIEAGQLKIVNKDFNLDETLEELFLTYKEINSRQHGEKVQLVWNKEQTPPISVINSDPHRIKQVLSNLIDNALKYTEEGQISFGYKILEDFSIKNAQRKIQFYIKDTGIGIAKDKINVIFDRFRQADDSHTRIFGGTGLGLAISKNIAQLLGGDINAVSKTGKGSVFYFTLPFVERTKITKSKKSKEISIKDIDWSNKTILIAEDVDSNFYLLKTLLKRTKINIIWVNNGEKAVKEINTNKNIDIILMDIQMPIMNGFEATEIIKNKFRDIPILAVTAFALEGDRDKIIQAGCDDYISKPIKSAELIAKINIYI